MLERKCRDDEKQSQMGELNLQEVQRTKPLQEPESVSLLFSKIVSVQASRL